MTDFETTIWLPPGTLPPSVVRAILQRALSDFGTPARAGGALPSEPLLDGEAGLEVVVRRAASDGWVTVAGPTDEEQLLISTDRGRDRSYGGQIVRYSARSPADDDPAEVAQLMRVVVSPLAYVASARDIRRKTEHEVSDSAGRRLEATVEDPSQGLPGLFWRTFLGPPFVRLLGERLNALPSAVAHPLNDELWLLQPYPDPRDADTQAGRARETELIDQLGPEHFYDPVRQQRPTRIPTLPPLDGPNS
jgi:hypothetical protein